MRMLEKGGTPDADTVRHVDNCLSCLSCMSSCAVKIDYVHLIDHARAHIEGHYRRPLLERATRWALATIIPRPRLFHAALAVGKARRILKPLLPRRLHPLLDMIPQGSRSNVLAPAVYPADAKRRKRVALLTGCAQQALNADINAATIRILRRHGCEVVIAAGAGCCGSLPLHMGKDRAARAFARKNILAWTKERDASGLDAIVVNASGCGTTVKDYGHLFGDDPAMCELARNIAALARDVSEILSDLGFAGGGNTPAFRVAYHDACSMQHGQKVTRQPRALLRSAGFIVLDVPEKHFCCGSAGTYNLLQPETAAALGKRKADHVASTDPDLVATGNIGCTTQIQKYSSFPVVHTVELLDWATGGPMPSCLRGVKLRTPDRRGAAAPRPDSTAAPDQVLNENANFW